MSLDRIRHNWPNPWPWKPMRDASAGSAIGEQVFARFSEPIAKLDIYARLFEPVTFSERGGAVLHVRHYAADNTMRSSRITWQIYGEAREPVLVGVLYAADRGQYVTASIEKLGSGVVVPAMDLALFTPEYYKWMQ